MTTAITANTSVSTCRSTDSVPLTSKQLEEKIRSINATQIETLAKVLASKVMSQLSIDVIRYAPVAGQFNTVAGQLVPVRFDQYDPESKLMKALLPKVVNQITQTFATPDQFLQEGLYLSFIGSEGLLDQVKSEDPFLAERITQSENRIMRDWNLNSFGFSLKLCADLERSNDESGVSFDIRQFMNGAFIGHNGGNLQGFEENVSQRTVF